MRFALLLVSLLTVDRFVTPDKLPTVPKRTAPPVQPPDSDPTPIPQVCQCGCGKANCNCGRTASSCNDAVQLDEAALTKAMSHKPTVSLAARQTQCLVFTMPGCPPCNSDKADRVPWITKSGWTESTDPNAHFRVVDIYENAALAEKHGVTACPTYVVTVNGLPVSKRTGSTPKETLVNDYLQAAKLAEANRPTVGAISVGKIKAEQVRFVRRLLGKTGTLQLGNEPIEQKFQSLTVKVPANFKLTWATDAAGKLTVNSDPQPTIHWGVLNQQIKTAVIADKRIDFVLPWAPDAMLEIED